ncbi:MAG TPA: hypothetical protein VM580_07350 [Labilithrix sp.]|nr:hypothetical protein [Labilithrix sp.]
MFHLTKWQLYDFRLSLLARALQTYISGVDSRRIPKLRPKK